MFREDGKVLLAKRVKPPQLWSLPGGKLEPGETAEAAAVRETREEVSVEIEIVGRAGERLVDIHDAGVLQKRFVITFFAATVKSGEPASSDEAAEVGWFTADEIETLTATAGLAEAVRDAARVLDLSKG
ncbi:MAG: NUDIX domain-containing protein [Xanthobacteraceae bacterium]|nr:NUDIX domain-containing protein [Xanthobacteraceae bacterium]QYK46565.1 MAG: NUDIX domain-containing protein [Xanthobacteraceae bacterium]